MKNLAPLPHRSMNFLDSRPSDFSEKKNCKKKSKNTANFILSEYTKMAIISPIPTP